LRVTYRQNRAETLLQEFGIIGLGNTLQECFEHVIYRARLSILNVALKPWAKFVDSCMNVSANTLISNRMGAYSTPRNLMWLLIAAAPRLLGVDFMLEA
jgi:hypothetical protein